MAAVMRHAADIDDQAYCKDFEELSRLRTENEILRELLMISQSPQGANLISNLNKTPPESSSPTDDAAQTEKKSETSDATGESP